MNSATSAVCAGRIVNASASIQIGSWNVQPKWTIGAIYQVPSLPHLQRVRNAFSRLRMSSVTGMIALTRVVGPLSAKLLVAKSVCIGFRSTSSSVGSVGSEPVTDANATDCDRRVC